jgi:hypothetical protein
MLLQDTPLIIPPDSPLLEALERENIAADAIAIAISDRIMAAAQEIGEAARRQMSSIDWVKEILRATEDKGVSEEIARSFGGFGDCVGLRIQIALTQYSEDIERLKLERQSVLSLEEETKKVTLEKRWEIRRNGHLSRIEMVLTVFSGVPYMIMLVGAMLAGAMAMFFHCSHSICSTNSTFPQSSPLALPANQRSP